MFNHTLYLPRYGPAIEVAVSIYPATHRILNGLYTPTTNISRIRECRNYIIANLHAFPDYADAEAQKNLSRFQVWADDDYTYLGNPKASKTVNPLTSAISTLAGDIHHPLTLRDLQVICYVLQSSIVTLPIRIHSPSPEIVTEIERLTNTCSNVEYTTSHDTITLF
tara:strand:+ start:2849 stop:3346 length:498 start_codon:yes stop_codon:yes gene_type:complete